LLVGSAGTLNTLEIARHHNAGYLHASTSECYGDPEVHPQTETYWGNVNPVGPRSVYDEAKRFSEAAVMAFHRYHGVNTHLVRIFNTYGPRLQVNDGRVISNLMTQALSGESLTIYGDGSQTRSFCYVSDLIEGILALADSEEHLPVNIGNPEEWTILQCALEILNVTGANHNIAFKPLPQDDPTRRRPDIHKAKTLWAGSQSEAARGFGIVVEIFGLPRETVGTQGVMATATYHLLTEAEPFPNFKEAISRWAANVLRDADATVVVCPLPTARGSFSEAIRTLSPGAINEWRHLLRLPWSLHSVVIQRVFRPVLKRLREGDIVWIHNRPDFAVALTPEIRRARARVVLHLHNSHLVEWPEPLMRQVQVDRLVFVSGFLLEQARRKFSSLGDSSVLYNGADEAIFYPPPSRSKETKTPTVLFAGRLVQDKGVHILMEAMRLIEQRGSRLRALIVGSSNFGGSRETDYVQQLKASAPRM
jgi:hypothetical protein